MAKKTVRLQGGSEIEGEVVQFQVKEEPWYEYACDDGTKIRMKVVVSEIIRLDNQFTPDGDPVYLVKSSNVVSTEAPDSLRRRPRDASGTKTGNYV